MSVTVESMLSWCRKLLGVEASPDLKLADYLAAIPKLSALDALPAGTTVLVRGDVDAKPGPTIGEGDIRLRSMLPTLEHGRQKGWKQVIFGHIGRKPEGSLKGVAARLAELLKAPVPLVTDWLDENTLEVRPEVAKQIADCPPGSVLVLDNTRRYEIERVLWKAKADDLPKLAPQLATFANSLAEHISLYYVNEALSAGSLDSSTTVVPAGMKTAALGLYVASEFEGPMQRCLATELVVFSGLKIDKLDDLQAMIDRGTIRVVIAAGSLAMALKKAAAQLDGGDFCLGVAEDPSHADKPYFIPAERVAQARGMIEAGRKHGVEFVLPVDFVLADGRVAEKLGPGDQQFDVGPQTSELLHERISKFIESTRGKKPPAVVFYNGVFGMFEDPKFEDGTRRFIGELKRLTDAGVEVYIGGGEGGTALEKYGQPNWVTHVFTAGGTVLNALGSEPVPYLVTLRLAAEKQK